MSERSHVGQRLYSSYAGIYDRVFGRVFQESRESVIRRLKVGPGERVLEVGVGTGLCLPLYPRHCAITAVDLSDGMLQQARARVQAAALDHVVLARMDAARMAFADDSFDVVVAAYVVTAVPDYRSVMREMVRVCKPQGRLILLNHFTHDSRLIAACEKAISPLCRHIGFRTDLAVTDVIDGWPLRVERDERVRPMGLWHAVECVNRKSIGA